MCHNCAKYRRLLIIPVLSGLLFFCEGVYSQTIPDTEYSLIVSPVSINHISDIKSLTPGYVRSKQLSATTRIDISPIDRNLIFYDTLKTKASRNIITRKLYDLVIISNDTTKKKQINNESDASYVSFSGKKIRNIVVQRLNVFGFDINKPNTSDPDKFESLLNKTHVNTFDRSIRKNLLFKQGDTISPLELSDNERLLRQLPYIDDARIIIIPVSDEESDILVLTKDVYSLGASYNYGSINRGNLSVFETNILGTGHALGIEVPFDNSKPNSPGFGVHYTINNILKSFINLKLFYLDGLGDKSFGFDISKKFESSTTKYAGGISVIQVSTTENLNNTLPLPEPLKYNLQDYWISRQFLINKISVSRIIVGARYTNNNVFMRPEIVPDSYYNLTKYRLYLGSVAYSVQKYYKTNLIYGYGRTEDIPYGGLFGITFGTDLNENNDFKKRTYLGAEVSLGNSIKSLGYFYSSVRLATFLDANQTKQSLLSLRTKYFSNLLTLGRNKIRNFVYFDYTNGISRYSNEYLFFNHENGLAGLKNDSISGRQRLNVSLESVLFSPVKYYGFRFAFFGFSDFSFLSGMKEINSYGTSLTAIGLGIRIGNDNLLFNSLQIRLAFFPNAPEYSRINNIVFSTEQQLKPDNFDSGPPSLFPYR
jgi:hypothetical protein